MHFPLPRTLRRRAALMAALAIVATLVSPMRMAWSAPATRYAALPVAPGGGQVDPAFPVTHFAVEWRGSDTDELEVRRLIDGSWGEWDELEADETYSVPLKRIVRTDLFDGGDADRLEVRVVEGAPLEVRVAAIDAAHGPRTLKVAGPLPASAELNPSARVEQPSIVSRSEWGADESMRTGTPSFAPIRRFAIHHTGEGTHHVVDPKATIRAMYVFHVKTNGWSDIGYNFIVDAQGRTYEGRWSRNHFGANPTGEDVNGNGVTGAHSEDNNSGTVGVTIIGNLDNESPTDAAVDGVVNLLAWKADRHNVDALGTTRWTWAPDNTPRELSTVVGHRDTKPTACPGRYLYPQIPSIRERIDRTVASMRGTTRGYWELSRDGRVFPYGQATEMPLAPAAQGLVTPAVSITPTPLGDGYWVLSGNGRVVPFGAARFHGSTEAMRLNAPVVRIEATPTGQGYWVLGADGGVFSFGDATFSGSTGAMRLNSPVISMASTPSGKGYWLLAGDGGVFSFGDATFHGSTGSMRLNAPVVSMSPAADGSGYWLLARDGGIFSFDVRYYGSVPGLKLGPTSPSQQIRSTETKRGYYILGNDGGLFTFGDAIYHGNTAGLSGSSAASDLALLPNPHQTTT